MPQIVHARVLRNAAYGALVSASLMVGAEQGAAAESAGCEAANRGNLNASVAAGGSAARRAPLEHGETLTIRITTRATATLVVSGGDSAPRTLHSGGTSSVHFAAPTSGSYEFQLSAEGEGGELRVTCASVASLGVERALLDRRKAFLSERDPDRIRIDRTPTAPTLREGTSPASPADGGVPRDVTASISVSELASAMKLGPKKDPGILDFWFEGRYTSYDAVDANAAPSDGNFSVMYFGSKYMVGPDIMLGYLAQFDKMGEVSRYDSGVSASGWMAGPYMSVRFGHGIVFDGRAAWGVTQNVPSGIALDTTSADRSLVRGTLRGTREIGGWTVSPSVGFSYVEDTLALQGTSFSEAAPAGTGRLDVLPEMKRRFDLNSDAYIEPHIAAGGFLAFDNISRVGPEGVTIQDPDLRWKAEAGVAVGVKDSVNLRATGGVETGGQAASDTWSGRLQLNMPLGK